MQDGIDELLAAQRGGYPNEAVLYRQLADGYGTMAIVFLAADARKQEEFLFFGGCLRVTLVRRKRGRPSGATVRSTRSRRCSPPR